MVNRIRPIIAICGGTGFQGGSVAQFILEDGYFAARVLTRKPQGAAAKRLEALGAEVVKADYDDPASLLKAFRGCYGVFAVTDYFEAHEREDQQGINLINAAKEAQIRHFVWSALEHHPDIPHFELKARVNDYLKKSGMSYTSFYFTYYYSNLFLMGFTKRQDGTWDLALPYPADKTFPCMAATDTGGWVLTAFLHPEKWLNKELKICSEHITPRQLARTFEEITGFEVHLREISVDDFLAWKKDEFPLGEGVYHNMKFFLEEGTRARDVAVSKQMHPTMMNWSQFAAKNNHAPPPQPLSIVVHMDVTIS